MNVDRLNVFALFAFLLLSLFSLRLIFANGDPVAFNDLSPMYRFDQLFRPYDFPWDYKSNLGAPLFLTGNSVYNVPLIGLSLLFGSVVFAHKVLLTLLMAFSGFGFYLAFSYLFKSKSAGFVAGLVMLFSPFILTRWMSGHNTMLLAYAVLPYALKSFFVLMRVGGKISLALCGVLTGLLIYVSPQVAYLFLLFAFLFGFFDLAFSKRVNLFERFKVRIFQFSLLVGMVLLVAFPFFYPLLMVNLVVYSTRVEEVAVSFLSPATRSMLFSQLILGVFALSVSLFLCWRVGFRRLLGGWKRRGHLSGVSFSLFSVGVREVSFFALLGLLSLGVVFVAMAYPLVYSWFFANVPGFGMFREVDKFLLLFALSLAFFVGFAASGLGRYLAKTRFSASVRRGVPVLLVCVLVLSSSYPYLSGDMGGAVKTVEVPDAYQLLDEWLTVQPETFRVAFFPPAVWATTYNWSSDWFLDPAVSLQSQPTLEVRSEMDLTSAASFSRWVYTQLYSHKVSEWGKFLALLGVEYVVVRLDADMPSYRNDLAGFSSGNTLAVLAAQKDFVLEKDFGAVKVYRNIHTLPHVYGAESFSVVAGDRRMLLSLANSDFNFRCYPAVFLDDAVDVSEVLIKNSGCLISQGDSYWSLIAASLGSKHIVEPWLYAPVSSNPWGRWVSGDLMWPFWGGALNVAVDGYIYSEGAANITIPLNVAAPGDYRVLAQVYVGAFPVGSNGVRFLSEGTGTVDYLFRTVRSTEGAYQWVDLGVSCFDSQSALTLCNLGGAAAVSKIAVLPVEQVEVATQNLLCMFEGCGADLAYVFDDFSWNYNVKAVVHNPLAGDGRLINLQKSGANTTFYVFKEDTYTLHSRFLLPDASVTVNVKVDEASSSVALASGGDDLVAVDLGCYYLGVGWHTLSLASSEDARLDLALLFTSPDMFNASGGAVASNFTMMSGSEYRVLVDGKNVVFLEGGYGYWQLYGDLEDAVVSVPVFNYGTIFLTGNEGNEYTLKYTGIDYVTQGVLAAFTALALLFLGLNFSPNKWFISPIRRETQFMES